MRFPRPSLALVIALLALLLAAGGSAYATVKVTGSAVNITDPTVASRVAHVSSAGSLQVGGSVTATQTSPVNFLQGSLFGLGGGTCQTLISPPSGKAMVLTQVTVDVFADPSPGSGNRVTL